MLLPTTPRQTIELLKYLKAINPAVEKVTTEAFGGYRSVQFFMRRGSEPFQASQMSDGTLRSLAVLVALFQFVPGPRTLSGIGLEEPETALHPPPQECFLTQCARLAQVCKSLPRLIALIY